jgi:hypothetical protein
MKVAESFGFFRATHSAFISLYLSKLILVNGKKIKESKVDVVKGFSFFSKKEKLARRRTALQQSNSIQADV